MIRGMDQDTPPVLTPAAPVVQPVVVMNKQRHFLAVFFLSFMWGTFGVDRFYLGKVWTGILKLITFGGLGLWTLIDFVLIMSGAMKDKQGNPMREVELYKKFAARTVLLFGLILGLVILISGVSLIYASYTIVTHFVNGGSIQDLLPFAIPGVTDNPIFDQYEQIQRLMNGDTSGIDLNGVDLNNIDFTNVDLNNIDLNNVDLQSLQ